MMSKRDDSDLLMFPMIFVAMFLGFGMGGCIENNRMQGKAIKHGAAEYNKTTGEFQWIDRGQDDE